MVEFVTGRSGSGKTSFLYKEMEALAKEGEKKLLFLIPEQLSFETEARLLEDLGARLSEQIKVMNFSRLCDFVMRSTGGLAGKVIDDGGKAILMSLAIDEVKDELSYFKGRAGSADMVNLMLSAVQELKTCGVTEDMLYEAAARTIDEGLKSKLRDTALVTGVYNGLLSNGYVDALDRLTKLKALAEDTNFFKGYTIAVDSFSGFTNQELEIIEVLIKQSERMLFSISASVGDLFYTPNRTMRLIKDICRKNGEEIHKGQEFTENKRTSSKALIHLEKNFLRKEFLAFDECNEDIQMYSAKDIYDECDYIARSIRRLVFEHGYRYKDIAVVINDEAMYKGVLDTAFERYSLSFFLDYPVPVQNHPLPTFISCVFDAIHTNFSTQSILKLLKTELTSITFDEVSRLENYAFMWDITGSAWLTEFKNHPGGYEEVFSENDKKALSSLEKLRKSIIFPILKFKKAAEDATALEISKAVFELLEDFSVPQNIRSTSNKLLEMGEKSKSQECARLWNICIAALDETVEILKDKTLSSRRYAELFEYVLKAGYISFIPQCDDQVTVGRADRIRLESIKVTFVAGAAEGEFPALPRQVGVFTDKERKRLLNESLPLYDDVEKLVLLERFNAYRAVTSPSEKLFVSFHKSSLSGEVKYPSIILREIIKISPNLSIKSNESFSLEERLWSYESVFEYTAGNWGNDSEGMRELKSLLSNKDGFQDRMLSLDALVENRPLRIDSNENIKKLYGDKMYLSASRVDDFYQCKFKHFLKNSIGINERKQAKIDSAEYGSLVHFLLEKVLSKDKISNLCKLEKAELLDIITDYKDEYLETKLGGHENKSARYLYRLDLICKTVLDILVNMLLELSQSSFQPKAFELSIAHDGDIEPYTLTLADGKRIVLTGKVDRVDIMQEEEKAYLRVVDYKTGQKKFAVTDLEFGLNLQMVIYLRAILKSKDKLIPAGVLYIPALDKEVSAYTKSEKKAKKDLSKEFVMRGLLLDENNVIAGMEDIPPSDEGVYIPVKRNKDGNYMATGDNALLSREQMKLLFRLVDEKLTQMANALWRGDISAVPAKSEDNRVDGCKYCSYANVCNFSDDADFIKIEKNKNFLEAEVNEDGKNVD